jgi:DNA (cytosine-5)-methyltransferase 1
MSIEAVDLFCGAGGTSSGILKACRERIRRDIKLTAVNHWATAINTHSLNHPEVRHICEPVENLHPLDLVKSGRLDLLAASCECRFHSNARGGGVCNEQSRSQPWQLVRWATDVAIENILMENVWEFQHWGPLLTKAIVYQGRRYRKGRPDPRRRGEFFRAFLNAIGNLGYAVDWKIQCAADYGDPTSRRRLILLARKGKALTWPEPTHGPGRKNPWRVSRECIDLKVKGKSLFGADGKPRLCANTVNRIEAGLIKFGGANAEPYLVLLRGNQ